MSPAPRRPAGRPPQGTRRRASRTAPTGRPSDDPRTLQREAEEQVRRNTQALRAHPLPVTAEPSFCFRP
jgi:hypothetical protein